MANNEHLKILNQGVEVWNKWRAEKAAKTALRGLGPDLRGADLKGFNLSEAHLVSSDLSGADLSKAKLVQADLRNAQLTGARLRDADLSGANLKGAGLSEADLSGTDLIRADLSYAFLTGANLYQADLTGANLEGAELEGARLIGARLAGANLREAIAGRTIFGEIDFRDATALETVRHMSPSTVGIDTIHRSHGKIPESFLRGCGVPEAFIEYMRSLTLGPVEWYSCFISYSTRDQSFAERLYTDLQAHGVRCWFAPHDIQGGRKILEQIDQAIRLHERLLLILSPESLNSEWVKSEITKAQKREIQERKHVLFPVRLCSFESLRGWESFDADTGKDLAREIREYFIPDFSNWADQESYRKAFDQLLRDLRAEKRDGQTS